MELRKNQPYTFKEMEKHFDGGQVYLSKRNGKIVTGCLVREKNPFAPQIMVVGTKPLNIKRADEFCDQRPIIPIFIKERINAWFFSGMFRISRVEFESEILRQSEKLYGGKLNRIIHLEEVNQTEFSEDDCFPISGNEGRKRLVMHFARERDMGLVKSKKMEVLKREGVLVCEACGFNFKKFYPDLGTEFAEIHHKTPLSEYNQPKVTTLEDLAVLCSNCHSAIHRIDPMPSVDSLRESLGANK